MKSLLGALLVSAAAFATSALAASNVVTIYAADGLHDGKSTEAGAKGSGAAA